MEKILQMLYDTFVVPVKDFRVLGWTLLMGVVAWITDPQGLRLISICCYVAFFWMFALCLRKIMFPYRLKNIHGKRIPLHLSDFFRAAYSGNIAAALIVVSQVTFMCVVVFTFVLWIRP